MQVQVNLATKLSTFPVVQQFVGAYTFLSNIIKAIGNIAKMIFNSIAVAYHEHYIVAAMKSLNKRSSVYLETTYDTDLATHIQSAHKARAKLSEKYSGLSRSKLMEKKEQALAHLASKQDPSSEGNSLLAALQQDISQATAENQKEPQTAYDCEVLEQIIKDKMAKLHIALADKFLAKHALRDNTNGIGLGAIRFTPVVGTIYSAVKWHKASQASN